MIPMIGNTIFDRYAYNEKSGIQISSGDPDSAYVLFYAKYVIKLKP